jgi:ATP-dependent DNA helicase RecG
VERLAWVEAFSHVWERLLAESRWGGARAPVLERDDAVLARLESALGFSLTTSQRRAIDAIAADLASPAPMRRLLLGDVGTGKTAVAMAAAAQCVTAGYQAAILAPTSVLAEQYRDALAPLARATMRDVALVSAGVPSAERRRAEAHLADGKVAVAAGTHALLSGSVTFARLGLVIVDEQHRLGVAQRLALVSKGTRPHLLTLSATPIPRTLALALRGELATCTLDERPRGRPPVETLTMPRERMTEVLALVRDATSRGERVFFVSPRIEVDAEDPEDDPSAAAVERAAELARALDPVRVEIVHGAMSAQQKRDAMRAFRSGDALVLVGTTVIEVGIDVPEATLMIVDRAERFGLAQLHQLRGRVGRGDRPGRCVLLHGELEPLAARRLEALVASSSGFEIARADLALRGAGDLWGTRQSGAEEELLYLDPSRPPPWLERIEDDARALRAVDPELVHPDHRGLALARARIAVAMAVREEAG